MPTKMVVIYAVALLMAASATALAFPDPEQADTSLGRRLAENNPDGSSGKLRRGMTCDVYPRVCLVEGSDGPDCCKKKCVNVDTDETNCGRCGRMCRYGQACCRGSCVNVLSDPNNCGRCMNMCKDGGRCKFGICNYA